MEARLQTAACRITNDRVNAYLESITESLREATIALDQPFATEKKAKKLQQWNVYDRFDVILVNSAVPNAGTWGEDFAVVHSRLLLECDQAEQVVAILAHEYGHILEEHTVDERMRYQGRLILVTALGAIGAASEAISNSYGSYGSYDYSYAYRPAQNQTDWANLIRLSMDAYSPFRRDDEYEADARGIALFSAAGYDPEEYVGTFEMMVERFGDEESRSHPSTSKRIRRLRSILGEAGSLSGPFKTLNTKEFEEIKTLVAEEVIDNLRRGRFAVFEQEITAYGQQSWALPSCYLPNAGSPAAYDRYLELLIEQSGELRFDSGQRR